MLQKSNFNIIKLIILYCCLAFKNAITYDKYRTYLFSKLKLRRRTFERWNWQLGNESVVLKTLITRLAYTNQVINAITKIFYLLFRRKNYTLKKHLTKRP
jgi:hypothetical protein